VIHLPGTKTLLLMTFVWAVAAYVIVPRLWVLYFRRHPLLVESARVTLTGDGHVRFWRWDELYKGRPGSFGAATFDAGVGLSHTTGQVTHHIAPDVDAERDRLASELQQACVVQSTEWKDGFHAELEGRNGGGDPWHTDGRLAIVSLRGSV
jgi:hypothetical protein